MENAKEIGKAFRLGLSFSLGQVFKRNNRIAEDASKWITVHPNGKEAKGRPALIDDRTGEVLGGMGGKFTGKHISAVPKRGKYEQHGAQAVINWSKQPKEPPQDKSKEYTAAEKYKKSASWVKKTQEKYTAEKFQEELDKLGVHKNYELSDPRLANLIQSNYEKRCYAGQKVDPNYGDDVYKTATDPNYRNKEAERIYQKDYSHLEKGEYRLTDEEIKDFKQAIEENNRLRALQTCLSDSVFYTDRSKLRESQFFQELEKEQKKMFNRVETMGYLSETRPETIRRRKEKQEKEKQKEIERQNKLNKYSTIGANLSTPQNQIRGSQDFGKIREQINNSSNSEETLSVLHSNGVIKTPIANVKLLSNDTAKEIAGAYLDVCEKFPFLDKNMVGGEVTRLRDHVYANCHLQDGSVNFSKNVYGDQQTFNASYKRDTEQKWHPAGTDEKGAAYAVTTHELGHALEGRIENFLRDKRLQFESKTSSRKVAVSKVIQKKVLKKLKLDSSRETLKDNLSEYAVTDSYEFFAESVCEYMISKNPRPIAKEVGSILEKIKKGDFSDLID